MARFTRRKSHSQSSTMRLMACRGCNAVGHANGGYIFAVHHLQLHQLAPYAAVNFLIPFAFLVRRPFLIRLSKKLVAPMMPQCPLQLVVKTDKEIKHLIRKFIGLVKHHKRAFLAFERVDDVVHHIRHRATP